MTKNRILICGENHNAASGFGKMTLHFCQKLHEAGYEVASLENGLHYNQINRNICKWTCYGVMPDNDDKAEYEAHHQNVWGAAKFEPVLLEFRPDYTFTFMDHWNCTHIFNSPFRKLFRLGYMSCVDSEPLKNDWLHQTESADDVFGYTDWALDVAGNQSTAINSRGFMPPGVDFSNFKPNPDRKKHREQAGLDPNWLISGMVARNQKRKLFPDLFAGFRLFLDKYSPTHKELTDRCKLFLHTTIPDFGYDIPYLIKEYGLCNRILMTYICRACKRPFVAHFRGERTSCIYCHQPAAFSPRVDHGVQENVLSELINLLDLYVHITTNEGLGIPQIEAGACSIPIMATNYSASSDVVQKLNGFPVGVKQLYREVETQAYKAVPDNEDLADRLFEFFSLPELDRKKKGLQTRLATLKHFNYDKNIKKLMECIDKADLDPNRWDKPADIVEIPTSIPEFSNFYDLTGWCITNILSKPELVHSHTHKRIVHDLNGSYRHNGTGTNIYFNENSMFSPHNMIGDFNVKIMIDEMVALRNQWNRWESIRTGQIPLVRKAYLDRAKP